MIVDLHAHYPMHLAPPARGPLMRLARSAEGRWHLVDRVRAALISTASQLANYPRPGSPAVTVEEMRAGEVGAALSVLYSPLDEMDLSKPRRGSPPGRSYFASLLRQLELVERRIAERHGEHAAVAHDAAELDALLDEGRLALVHAVEGAFHLGSTPESMSERVAELAQRGVAYITVAHLFWRGIATNAPALPFLSDRAYRLIFRQPDVGLTELGEAAVRAMVRERVLVDVTHMSSRSLDDTFALLDTLDPERRVPVLASHIACRFGRREYNLDDTTIARVAERGGVLGVIFCEHFLTEGRSSRPRTFEQSVELIVEHIDRIARIAGSYDHAAIGSDLDGYIKPTVPGLERMSAMKPLADALTDHYGPEVAGRVCSENALRMLRAGWR